jgi:hypothetical protein
MRTRLLLALAAAVLTTIAVAGFVRATPAAGVTSTTIASGTLAPMNLMVKTDDWMTQLRTKGETTLQVVENRVAPGGSFGWHSHPGPSLLIVKQGTITFYRADDPTCTPDVRTAGQTALVNRCAVTANQRVPSAASTPGSSARLSMLAAASGGFSRPLWIQAHGPRRMKIAAIPAAAAGSTSLSIRSPT